VAVKAWRIARWSRERGRGAVECGPGGEHLEFDAAVAHVDDFEVGESVHVRLKIQPDESYRVTEIWPDDPRVYPSDPTHQAPPPLDPDLEHHEALLAGLPRCDAYRIDRLGDGDLVIHGTEPAYAGDEVVIEVCFSGVEYLDLPFSWEPDGFRLANASERLYLAERTNGEISQRSVAVKIRAPQDQRSGNAYFVVCGGVAVRSPSPWRRRRPAY